MARNLPPRLLCQKDGKFEVINTSNPAHQIDDFDILSYTWGAEQDVPYKCDIPGVLGNVKINTKKLKDIQNLMEKCEVQYLWVDCVCLNQEDEREKSAEIHRMHEYYKSARKCYILMDVDEVWDPQEIVDDLKFIGYILAHMKRGSLSLEPKLIMKLVDDLARWGKAEWKFPMSFSLVKPADIDAGLLNCYSTCIGQVKSLFNNPYFSRVWTFQEMLLGKEITIYGVNNDNLILKVGELDSWMNLVIESQDKAAKLFKWIDTCRSLKTTAVNTVLRIIKEDLFELEGLLIQVKGMNSAKTDITNGGAHWWHENHKGISNVFSAISLRERYCTETRDVFRGLFGIFSGLFKAEDIETYFSGDNVEKMSFMFFRQLSIKTGCAWTKLALSSAERGEYDWIPMVPTTRVTDPVASGSKPTNTLTTNMFSAVVNLGVLKAKGSNLARAPALTGLLGTPRKFMTITLTKQSEEEYQRLGFPFEFKGCNCGKEMSTGFREKEKIEDFRPEPVEAAGDQTGKTLVQCATILGSLLDPGSSVVTFRQRLLTKLHPRWRVTNDSSIPIGWVDGCVSGTDWERPVDFRVHNRWMNTNMGQIYRCGSRLETENTKGILCTLKVNCGCTITAPFALIFEALAAVKGSSISGTSATLSSDRIVLRDGLALVQAGEVGATFKFVAMQGDIDAFKSFSKICRSTKPDKKAVPKLQWPRGRVLVRQHFRHGMGDSMRDYGYLDMKGSGNLMVCRNSPVGIYKVVGICVDGWIENKKGRHTVTIC